MKKLQTKQAKEKKKKINQLLVGIVMVAILVLATAGFALMSKETDTVAKTSKITINNFKFEKQDSYWTTIINEKIHAFFFLPTDIEDVEINITNNLMSYINKPIYIVNTNNAENQIIYNLYPEYILRKNNACLVNETCEIDAPIKDCSSENIIIFKESQEEPTKVYQIGTCIYIEGDIMKGADKFTQKILGIQ